MRNTSLYSVPRDLHFAGQDSSLEERLELGEVLLFEPGMSPLPPEEDLKFLRNELSEQINLKNISYHPEGGFISGMKQNSMLKARTTQILHEHNEKVQHFLGTLLPEYSSDWRICKVNVRPLQEKGRKLSRHSSNEYLHIDARAAGATHGNRILRFFSNINLVETRVWKSAGLFPELYQKYGEAAGIASLGKQGLKEAVTDKLYTGALYTISRLGLPQLLMADSSPYDRAMQMLHHYLKDDDDYQTDNNISVQLDFPPMCSWLVMTDTVSHAVVSGQHSLVNTYYVKRRRCKRQDLVPYNIIAGLTH